MKKILISISAIVMFLLASSNAEARNTIFYGTIGTGASATADCNNVELYTVAGLNGSGYVRLEIPDGIPLNEIESLSYTAKIVTLGPSYPGMGSFAPEVVLNIDADGTDGLEGNGIEWMLSGYSTAKLSGDNFLSGDYWPANLTAPDANFVTRNALTEYYYWSANDVGNGFGSFWLPWSSISLPVHNINPTDKVYSVDIVAGTSGSFDGMRVLVSSIRLNDTTYPVITTPTKACVLIGSDVPGKGLDTAPGLQKPFNPNSRATEHAGKK